jgi:integrase
MPPWHVHSRPNTAVLHCNFTVAGKLVRRSTRERDRTRADESAARLYLEAHRRARVPVPDGIEAPRLSAVCSLYLADLKRKIDRGELSRGPSYFYDQKKAMKRTAKRWASVDDVGPGWKTALADWHAEKKKYATLRQETVAVRAMLRWCVESKMLATMPVLTPPTAEEANAEAAERRPMTESERDAFLAALKQLDVRAYRIYAIAFYSGARRSDLSRMTLRQIDWKSGFVTLPPKLTKSRKRDQSLYLHPRAHEALRAHVDEMRLADLDAPVFGDIDLRHWFVRALEQAGILDRHGLTAHHVTRHTAATLIGEKGATLAELMAFGRWATPSMAARYMKVSQAQAKAAASRL